MKIKYLIIRFSSIGDIVLTSPVIRVLKQQVEDSEIHYLTKEQYKGILENNPNIDKIHILKKSFSETISELRKEGFDYIIDLHHNLRTMRIKNRLKVMDFSVNKLNREKWIMVRFKKDKLPEKHIVDRYLDCLKVFDIKNDGKGLDYFIPSQDIIDLKSLPQNLSNGYIVFSIGGQHVTKQLPPESIIEICINIHYPIILLGGKEDFSTGEIISENLDNVINLCGKYNLNQSASLVEQAKLIITHDTGLMHIAAAFKKIIFSVWGNTIPEFGMTPYCADSASKIFEVKDLSCRPCSKIGYKECPKKHFKCMKDQDLKSIYNTCNTLLKITD
jgi:ADP-heptose:LPS heptosyltransferase